MEIKAHKNDTLKVLCLEDLPPDAEIMRELLTDAGYDLSMDCTATENEFVSLLRSRKYDIILADFKLPGFDGFAALRWSINLCPDVPFICVSGTIGEDTAVELLKQGAVDYVFKDRMGRLAFAVQRALDEAKEKETRRRAEEALRVSEQRFRSLFENMLEGYAYCEMLFDHDKPQDFIYIGVNKAFEELTGLKNVVGKKVSEVIPGIKESNPELFEIYGRVALTGKPERFETYVESLGIWLSIAVYCPEKKYFIDVFDNITERKRTEEQAKKLEEYLKLQVERMPNGLIVWDKEFRVRSWNPAAEKIFGFTLEEALGKHPYDFIVPPNAQPHVDTIWRRLLEGDLTAYSVNKNITKDGRTIICDWSNTPLKEADGTVTGVLSIVQDITERKQIEEAIKKSREKYQQLYDEAPVGYHELDCKGTIVQVNKTEADMLGYTIHDMLGKSIFDFIAPEERKAAKKGFRQRMKDQQSIKEFERKYMRKNGEAIYFYIIDRLVTNNEGKIIGMRSTLRDITERRRAEEERVRLETAIEHAADIVIITDVDGTIQYVNPAFERITGYTREEAIGQNPRILKSGKHDETFYKELWDTISNGKMWKGHFINKKKDGTFYEEDAFISPIKNSIGSIVNYVAVKRDVTNEVVIEQRLREAQKLEAIGTMAGGIAHDFNNILAAIIGYAELSISEVTEGSQIHSDLERIVQAGYRARGVINQILTFSRKREQEKNLLQITPIIKEALKLMRATLPSTISIVKKIKPDVGYIVADPSQIHQIVMNLCTNAAHAMRENGGTLTVQLDEITLDDSFIYTHPGLQIGRHIILIVSDTGHGMTNDIKERIFEPYFTTDDKGEGSGLGLAIVHGIVKSCNGTITVYSEPQKGSTFKIYLPVTDEEPTSIVKKTESIKTGSGRILLVDDEPDLIEVGTRILKSLGYEVTAMTSSVEALDFFQKNPDQIDLVITDMTMPFIPGDELAREIFEVRPDMPVIICTGYSERLTMEEAMTMGIRDYLGKPLLKSEIAEKVHRILGERTKGADHEE